MIIAFLIVLGLCFGSFDNALVWRLRELSEPKKKRVASDAELSIAKGRSMCPNCQHTLAWYDLVPVFSWLSVRGKCRYCHKPISAQYPIVELATAGLFVASYQYWPQAIAGRGWFDLGLWLAAVTAFVALTIYDLRWMLLPDKIVYPLIVLAGCNRVADSVFFNASWRGFMGSLVAALIGGGLFYVLFQVSDGRWIGGGDVKLGFALGFLAGDPLQAVLLLMIASVLGLLGALPAVVAGKMRRDLQIPFGPFLMAGCFVVVLFGHSLTTWYMRILLPSS
jgi:leader peptidase (prepilin peptidase) / N-methyltransferase